jgi:hypothetical protein
MGNLSIVASSDAIDEIDPLCDMGNLLETSDTRVS